MRYFVPFDVVVAFFSFVLCFLFIFLFFFCYSEIFFSSSEPFDAYIFKGHASRQSFIMNSNIVVHSMQQRYRIVLFCTLISQRERAHIYLYDIFTFPLQRQAPIILQFSSISGQGKVSIHISSSRSSSSTVQAITI